MKVPRELSFEDKEAFTLRYDSLAGEFFLIQISSHKNIFTFSCFSLITFDNKGENNTLFIFPIYFIAIPKTTI